MEKRTTKIYITIFILALIGVSFALPFLKADVYNRTQVQMAELWNDKMDTLGTAIVSRVFYL